MSEKLEREIGEKNREGNMRNNWREKNWRGKLERKI